MEGPVLVLAILSVVSILWLVAWLWIRRHSERTADMDLYCVAEERGNAAAYAWVARRGDETVMEERTVLPGTRLREAYIACVKHALEWCRHDGARRGDAIWIHLDNRGVYLEITVHSGAWHGRTIGITIDHLMAVLNETLNASVTLDLYNPDKEPYALRLLAADRVRSE